MIWTLCAGAAWRADRQGLGANPRQCTCAAAVARTGVAASAAVAEPPVREVPSIGREQTEAAKESGSGYDWAHQWYPVRAFSWHCSCCFLCKAQQKQPHNITRAAGIFGVAHAPVCMRAAKCAAFLCVVSSSKGAELEAAQTCLEAFCSAAQRAAGALCAGCARGPAAARVAV